VTAKVRRTERPARMEGHERTHGKFAELVEDLGYPRDRGGRRLFVDGLGFWGRDHRELETRGVAVRRYEERMAQFAQFA